MKTVCMPFFVSIKKIKTFSYSSPFFFPYLYYFYFSNFGYLISKWIGES